MMGFLWLILGLCLTVLAYNMYRWNESRKTLLKWWQWLLTGIWVLMVLFTVGFIGTAIGEGEPRAALTGGIIIGLLLVVLGVGLYRQVLSEKTEPTTKTSTEASAD